MTEETKKQLPVVQDESRDMNILDSARYEHVQRVAKVYLGSSMIPGHFKKLEDVFVVCQMAFRMNVDPLMLLQNTYVVSGKPGLTGQMGIALVNASGILKGRLKFRYEGKDDTRACTAWGIDRESGEILECRIDMEVVKGEGWLKNTKWKTMRDQMLAYRAGAWFGRMYCPDALFGLQTSDELDDVDMLNVTPKREEDAADLDALLAEPSVKVELIAKTKEQELAELDAADAAEAEAQRQHCE